MKEIEFWINGVYYKEKDENVTIFQKCFEKKIDIPCFCYHENLSIAGNCRMCLVEVNTSVKLVASCAMPLTNGMKIETNSLRVIKARESIIEFLLINHPLDCPICDQGGECDLQEITLVFGSDKGRYYEYSKRAVLDKEGGPFVKMIMTRCIHCTRCVRFLNEVSGVSTLGMLNRGNSSEISSYIKNKVIDELSGNIIDLCPVGALTSKPYAFTARPWELNYVESIDILDSICSNVRIDYLHNKILRVLPVYNKNLNEDWITNRVRFFYDSNNIQRLKYPMMRVETGKYIQISWSKLAFVFFDNIVKYTDDDSSVLAFSGILSDLESIYYSKLFFNSIGADIHFSDFTDVNADFRENFLMNNSLVGIEENTNFIFFCLNTRLESPILNARLRKLYLLNDNIKFYGFGINNSYLNLPIKFYGNSLRHLIRILNFRSDLSKDLLFNNYNYSIFDLKRPKKDNYLFFFGLSFFRYNKASYLLDFFKLWINKNFIFKYSVVFPFVGYINFFEINGSSKKFISNKKNFIFLNNVDDKNFLKIFDRSKNFIVYYGSFFGEGAENADLIIPAHSVFEYDYKYLNVEGKLKKTMTALNYSSNNISAEDLFKFLMIFKKHYVPHNFSNIDNFYKVMEQFKLNNEEISTLKKFDYDAVSKKNGEFIIVNHGTVKDDGWIYSSSVMNYYNIDIYSRMSPTLSSASFDYMIRMLIFI